MRVEHNIEMTGGVAGGWRRVWGGGGGGGGSKSLIRENIVGIAQID